MTLLPPNKREALEMEIDSYLQDVYKEMGDITLEGLKTDEDLYVVIAAYTRAGFGRGVLTYSARPHELKAKLEPLGYKLP